MITSVPLLDAKGFARRKFYVFTISNEKALDTVTILITLTIIIVILQKRVPSPSIIKRR